MPWRIPINLDRPTEPLDSDAIAAIHEGAMSILEEIGTEFLNQAALDLFRKVGCKVKAQNVRMGRDFVMEMTAKAPENRPTSKHRTLQDMALEQLCRCCI